MKQGKDLRFFALSKTAMSLHSLIADGKYRETNVAKSSWKNLLKDGQLQRKCNKQGFNILKYVRIGIMSNQEDDCKTCDSWIGFGLKGENTCGNFAAKKWMETKQGADEKVMGYILVQ